MRVTVTEFYDAIQFVEHIEKQKGISDEDKAEIIREVLNIIPEGVVAQQFKRTAESVRSYLRGKAERLAPAKKIEPLPDPEEVEVLT
jgi:hypothetical protein